MNRFLRRAWCGFLFGLSVPALAAMPEWHYSQDVPVAHTGEVKFKLPLETLSAAAPGLSDLRLADPSGQEVAFFIDKPAAVPEREMKLEHMTISLQNGKTVITGGIPAALRTSDLQAVHLWTTTVDFLKPVTLEVSPDGKVWKTLLRHYPVFKDPGEAASPAIELPPARGAFLRVTIEDGKTPPIRVWEVQVVGGAKPVQNLDTVEGVPAGALSDAHQTEITVELPAQNMDIAAIRIAAEDPAFRRRVGVYSKTFYDGAFHEEALGAGFVDRVALQGAPAEQLSVPIGRIVKNRQIVLRIENGDNRPLTVTRIAALVVPQWVVFDAATAGNYTLWSDNPSAGARVYDIAAQRASFAKAPFSVTAAGALTANPVYQAPEPLPQVSEEGAEIDISPWRFRKKIALQSGGLQRLELDLEAIAHNDGRPAALRLVRDGRQLPYVPDLSSVGREFAPALEPLPADGTKSRWKITLPFARVPLQQLRFTVGDPLFQRTMTVEEERVDEQGEAHPETLGSATWTRTNGETKDGFTLTLYQAPRGKELTLRTDNADNPPIHLGEIHGYYQAPRLLFKASPSEKPLYLYYGQSDVAAPQYDLNLIAPALQQGQPREATLGPEEALSAQPWYDAPVLAGKTQWFFWAAMALVVLGLLAVIAKLLPADETAH